MCHISKLRLLLSFIVLIFEYFAIYCCDNNSTDYSFTNNDEFSENSDEIEEICPEFKIKTRVNSMKDLNFSIPNEREIARLRHVNGIKPIHYNWTMNFIDFGNSNFTSSIRIEIEAIDSVGRLILDFNPISLTLVDTTKIFLKNITNGRIICFESVIFVDQDRCMILGLKEKLDRGRYILDLGSFVGSPLSRKSGSSGLQVGGDRSSNWALTTIFQMRGARTVFPCFDHPSLKSTFRVCIEHSNDTVVASNTEVNQFQILDDNRIFECFEETRKIPVYILTLTLLRNFSLNSNSDLDPRLDIYYPNKVGLPKYYWEFEETRLVISFMENVTGFSFPLKKLGFLNVNNAPFWGVENFGLITLESGFTQASEYERGRTIVVHEIIHQWLGDVATISDWSEICLQEGLTALFEWIISSKFEYSSNSVSELAREARYSALYKSHANPVVQLYNETKEIADYCFGKPAVVFHMIHHFNDGIWEKFLRKLLKNFAYSNANLTDWVNTLNDVSTGNVKAGTVFESWFAEVGYPVFYSKINKQNEIEIKQFVYLNDNGDPPRKPYIPSRTIITPLRVYTKNGIQPHLNKPLMIKFVDNVYQLNNISTDEWHILDPSSVTLSRKIYAAKNYLALINCFNIDSKLCTASHLNDIFGDFCYALTNDWLPLISSEEFDAQTWTEVFAKIFLLFKNSNGRSKKLRLDEICHVCIRTKEDFQTKDNTEERFLGGLSSVWNENCNRLRLITLLGRNYTISETK